MNAEPWTLVRQTAFAAGATGEAVPAAVNEAPPNTAAEITLDPEQNRITLVYDGKTVFDAIVRARTPFGDYDLNMLNFEWIEETGEGSKKPGVHYAWSVGREGEAIEQRRKVLH